MSVGKAAARLFTDPAVARSILDELFPTGGLAGARKVDPTSVTPMEMAVPFGVAKAKGVPEEALIAARGLSESMPGPEAMRTALAIMEQPQSMVDDVLEEAARIGGRDASMARNYTSMDRDIPINDYLEMRDADVWNTSVLAGRDRVPPRTVFKTDLSGSSETLSPLSRSYLRAQQSRRYLMQQLLESAAGGDQAAAREMARQLGLINLLDDPSWVAR